MEKRGWVREEGKGLDSGDEVVAVVVADMDTLVGGVGVDDDGCDDVAVVAVVVGD